MLTVSLAVNVAVLVPLQRRAAASPPTPIPPGGRASTGSV